MMLIARIHVLSVALFLFLSFLLSVNSSFAETKTFIKEYTYQASEADSKLSCRTVALREVKRLLLEELGTYLESQTEVKNFQLTKDQITTLTAGIVSTEVIEDKWDGKIYWLKAKITANPQDVIKSIDSLRKDREKSKELEEIRKLSDNLLKENERLRKELATTNGEKREQKKTAYNKTIKELDAIEWFEKAQMYYKVGNFNEAINALNKSIEIVPIFINAYYSRAYAYENLGNYNLAIQDYNMAIEIQPNDAAAYFGRGQLYSALNNFSSALLDYNKAIELNPKYALAFYYRGNTHGILRNYNQAINDYNKTLELDKIYAEIVYLGRGASYFMLRDYKQAINDYDKTIELLPKYAQVYVLRGDAYSALGNFKKAIQNYDKAIELNPQNSDAYYNRGIAYGKLGNNKRAIDDYEIAARLGDKGSQDFLKSIGISW